MLSGAAWNIFWYSQADFCEMRKLSSCNQRATNQAQGICAVAKMKGDAEGELKPRLLLRRLRRVSHLHVVAVPDARRWGVDERDDTASFLRAEHEVHILGLLRSEASPG